MLKPYVPLCAAMTLRIPRSRGGALQRPENLRNQGSHKGKYIRREDQAPPLLSRLIVQAVFTTFETVMSCPADT